MTRRDDVFHVLKVIRRTLDVEREGIEPAIAEAARDRTIVKALADAIDVHGPESLADLQQLHSMCQFLISERETLGKALESIRRDIDNAGIEPRTRNAGKGGSE
jgi:hypothetical protein